MRHTVFFMLLLIGHGAATAQTDFRTRNPVGLFQDMKADTVTSAHFNHFAPTPLIAFKITTPVPGQELTGANQGMAVIDFNHDGYPDLLKADEAYAGQAPSRLLLGRGDGTFAILQDSGLPAGLTDPRVADLDNDGWEDVVCQVTSGGTYREKRKGLTFKFTEEIRMAVFRNRGGQRFEDVTTPWLAEKTGQFIGACVFDVDQDGRLDLLLTERTAERKYRLAVFQGTPRGFVAGQGVPLPDGLSFDVWTSRQPVLISAFDLDADGDLDVILQETGFLPRRPRLLVVSENEGGRLQPWENSAFPGGSRLTSLSWMDVNNDGRWDAYAGLSDYDGGRNQLYLNRGPEGFVEQGRQWGLWAGYNNCSGGCWTDFDNDGYPDLVQGRDFAESAYTEPALYLNDQGRRFLNVTDRAVGTLGPGTGSIVALDADQDGDQDLLYGHLSYYSESSPIENTGMKLLRNDGEAGHWLEIKLVGTRSNRSAIGGQATVYHAEGSLSRNVAGGMFHGRNQPALSMHFGLDRAVVTDSVVVRWPDGAHEWWPGSPANRQLVLTEGEGESRSGK
jgi:hypothetical protein|nr:CRTAC1 family protein [Candidatus Krumholzibacteria bacterium]